MKNTKIPLADTGLFSSLLLNYLADSESLRPFYHRFPQLESFADQIAEKGSQFSAEKRDTLVQSLKAQYSGTADAPIAQIEALGKENTFTVTTGHQLNIFTGPLYFIYKIVTVINMAERLNKAYPDQHFVPVYWMATEDHDFEEISQFSVFGKTFRWENEDAAGAVGRLSPKGMERILEEFSDCPALFRTAYSESKTLAEATRYIVHQLFGKHGLLVVDGDDANLKRQFRHTMRADLHDHAPAQAVRTTNGQLEAAGLGQQAFVRNINLFYLKDALRERIEKLENGDYKVLNTDLVFSADALNAEVENHPERFSPNVILRPLYQETILPNLAYIGGPAEVAYWFQLKDVFQKFETPFPIIFPRNIALVIPKTIKTKLDKFNMQYLHLFSGEQPLKAAYLDLHSQNDIELSEEEKDAEALFQRIVRTAKHIDPTLVGFVEAESKKALKSINTIEKRLKKAEERNHETALNQLVKIKHKLFPNGAPQERADNFLSFYINDGQFLDRLLLEFNPFDFRYNVLEYQA